MRAELSRVEITGPEPLVRAAEQAADDLRATGKITGKLEFKVDDAATELSVIAELAEVQPAELRAAVHQGMQTGRHIPG